VIGIALAYVGELMQSAASRRRSLETEAQ